MSETGIETRLVYGFLDAGKTTYILDCIRNDFFYKYGSTLILCFEQGEVEYRAETLQERNATVAYYDGEEDVGAFCLRSIETYRPDRIYVEMNAMLPDLREQFPACMRVAFAVMWIDWETLKLYFINFKQMISQMAAQSQQITFRGCPSKALLEPYSQAFRFTVVNQTVRRDDLQMELRHAFSPFSLPLQMQPSLFPAGEIHSQSDTHLPPHDSYEPTPASKVSRFRWKRTSLRFRRRTTSRSGSTPMTTRSIMRERQSAFPIRWSCAERKRAAHGRLAEW